MTHEQRPLGTPFSPAATADEVLEGVDLTGRNAIVTAGHSGLGLETTRALAKAGAAVTVAARNPEQARAAVAGIRRVEVEHLDLLDPASIQAFADRWRATHEGLHILVNSAAVPTPGRLVLDARGYEVQFATGHLGHFQLTLALHPALRAARGARVVNVTSGAHRFGDIRWHDPHFADGYDPGGAYAQTKTANILFAVALDRRWAADNIHGYAVHPGVVVGTKINTGADVQAMRAAGLMDADGKPVIDPAAGKKTPAQGASTIVFAATSELLTGIGGVYLRDNDVAPVNDERLPVTADSIPTDVASHAIDPDSAARLWDLGERLLGLRPRDGVGAHS
ncbi:MAG TPA: SDR family NAD(P)-dependent oxidoreductase [Umezawaea sp.]|nr:SDR family NAD(P)-dependent oxidoreductase [Umezawaea sp.]